jgi:hypothetical protein
MKRAIGALANVVIVAAFVAFVEFCCRRRPRPDRVEEDANPAPAKLRVRRGIDRRRVMFSIEGTLDEFTARMLACCVSQVPAPATIVVDLSEAGPIQGRALALFARTFASGHQVRLRGLGKDHAGLLPLAA